MDRRSYLMASLSAFSIAAGCVGGEDSDIKDTDGDGMIDSQDYAPKDPEVQEKSDLERTDTITPTPSQTTVPTPTTEDEESSWFTITGSTPTTTAADIREFTLTFGPSTDTPSPSWSSTDTPTSNSNTIDVNDDYWEKQSHISSYGSEEVSIVLHPDGIVTNFDEAKLYVGLLEFPRGRVVHETLGPEFTPSGGLDRQIISVDIDDVDSHEKYNYLVGLVPGNTSVYSIDYGEMKTIMETNPFEFQSDGSSIARTSYTGELDDETGSNYSRSNVEGAYYLEISSRTRGESWTVEFFGYKSAHASAFSRSRGRSRPEFVQYELTSGSAAELANLLREEAKGLGFSGYNEVEFVIDFVQALPYVPDDVSTGFDDYTKFIMETMPEMGGDCEDTAIMLASILQAEPFNYDMILIQPPGHMAAGIWQSEPEGWYWELDGRKYSYIETTGQGWGIGDCPEDYQNSEAYPIQV